MNKQRRWAFVTGATGGMGRAIVGRCVQDGYSVVAIGRNRVILGELGAEFGQAVVGLEIDLADSGLEARVGELAAELIEHGNAKIVGLVNAAGVSQGNSIDKILDEDWQRSLDVNVTAPMRLVRVLLPYLDGGSIVNIGSPVALIGARKVSYSASKAALFGLNAALAAQLGGRGIRVNAVLPGATITGMTEDWSPEKRTAVANGSPLGRLCKPEDIAGAVAFLLGKDSAYITGTILNVTGGTHIGM